MNKIEIITTIKRIFWAKPRNLKRPFAFTVYAYVENQIVQFKEIIKDAIWIKYK